MLSLISGWLSGIADHFARQVFVDRLGRLSDRQLDDIGLRRDQLDSLRLPSERGASTHLPSTPMKAAHQSLQGCG